MTITDALTVIAVWGGAADSRKETDACLRGIRKGQDEWAKR